MLDSNEKSIQLERDAVRGLRNFRTRTSIERLAVLLNDPDVFVRVRMEAAHALASLAGSETEMLAATMLVDYLRVRSL